jgi:hypothetical protein
VTEVRDIPQTGRRFERAELIGTRSADRIRASGHVRRVEQAGHMSAPDRRTSAAMFPPCAVGAVHTCPGFVDIGTFAFRESAMAKTRLPYAPEFRRQMGAIAVSRRRVGGNSGCKTTRGARSSSV